MPQRLANITVLCTYIYDILQGMIATGNLPQLGLRIPKQQSFELLNEFKQ